MGSASTLFHLAGALRRAIGRVFVTFFLTLLIVGGASEAAFYVIRNNQSPDLLAHVVSAFVAVGWAIAVSLVVLVGEIIRGLVTGAKDAVKDVEKEVGQAGSFVGGVVQSVEHRGDKK